MLEYLEYLFLGIVGFGLSYTALATFLLYRRRVQAPVPRQLNVQQPPISVFKPLKGVDEDLEVNLRSFFELDYPSFELLFGINDLDDPAVPVVQKLQRQYAHVASRLIVNEKRAGVNPKVNNLINMYPFAHFEYLVVSDSNVCVTRDYLSVLMAHMPDESVGLVTSSVRGVGAETLGATLENLHLNTFVAYNVYAVLHYFRVPITIGKSMLIRRATLQQMGGFVAFRDFLMEDGLIGRAVQQLGLKVVTTFAPVDNVNRTWRVDRFLARHLRWATMRRYLSIGHYFAELLSNPVLFALLYTFLNPSQNRLDFLAVVVGLKIVLDAIAGRVFASRLPVVAYLLVPIKELLIAALWVIPFFVRTVEWRGNRFRIGALTRVSPLTPAMSEPDVTIG